MIICKRFWAFSLSLAISIIVLVLAQAQTPIPGGLKVTVVGPEPTVVCDEQDVLWKLMAVAADPAFVRAEAQEDTLKWTWTILKVERNLLTAQPTDQNWQIDPDWNPDPTKSKNKITIVATKQTATNSQAAVQASFVSGGYKRTTVEVRLDFGGKDKKIYRASKALELLVLAVRLDVVLDGKNRLFVDDTDPTTPFVRFGIWDKAYTNVRPRNVPEILNGPFEDKNFVGSDSRRFYFRVVDPSANKNKGQFDEVSIDWFTLKGNDAPDDKPKNSRLILEETGPNTGVFASRAVMLVTSDWDLAQPTNTGLAKHPGSPGAGEANHRTRRAFLDGSVVAVYRHDPKVECVTKATVFDRLTAPAYRGSRDERRLLPVRVVNYQRGGVPYASAAYIAAHIARSQQLWTQVGLKVEQTLEVRRDIAAKEMLDKDGFYTPNLRDEADPLQKAVITDLLKFTADKTLYVVFLPLQGTNAYTTVRPIKGFDLGDRFFIMMGVNLDVREETLGHELFHALYNRQDGNPDTIPVQFFTFVTRSPAFYTGPDLGNPPDLSKLPNSRIYRRIHPFSIDWFKLERKIRYLNPEFPDFAVKADVPKVDDATGNLFVEPFPTSKKGK